MAGPGRLSQAQPGLLRLLPPHTADRIAAGEISTEHLATHVLPLEQGPAGYEMFKAKDDGCVRAVFRPGT